MKPGEEKKEKSREVTEEGSELYAKAGVCNQKKVEKMSCAPELRCRR